MRFDEKLQRYEIRQKAGPTLYLHLRGPRAGKLVHQSEHGAWTEVLPNELLVGEGLDCRPVGHPEGLIRYVRLGGALLRLVRTKGDYWWDVPEKPKAVTPPPPHPPCQNTRKGRGNMKFSPRNEPDPPEPMRALAHLVSGRDRDELLDQLSPTEWQILEDQARDESPAALAHAARLRSQVETRRRRKQRVA